MDEFSRSGIERRASILLLEDEDSLADELGESLVFAGFDRHICQTVDAFWRHLGRHEVDLLIVDLGLPDGHGLDVIREIRKTSQVPILITSGRAEVEERVAGIEVGADDYVTKPYSSREIVAKISRLLSRSGGEQYSLRSRKHMSKVRYRFASLVVDTKVMTLATTDGQDIPLTTYEFLLMKALVESPNCVMTRAKLVDYIHDEGWHGSERTIDNLISRLRAKIKAASADFPVKAIRGIGYIFAADVIVEY